MKFSTSLRPKFETGTKIKFTGRNIGNSISQKLFQILPNCAKFFQDKTRRNKTWRKEKKVNSAHLIYDCFVPCPLSPGFYFVPPFRLVSSCALCAISLQSWRLRSLSCVFFLSLLSHLLCDCAIYCGVWNVLFFIILCCLLSFASCLVSSWNVLLNVFSCQLIFLIIFQFFTSLALAILQLSSLDSLHFLRRNGWGEQQFSK